MFGDRLVRRWSAWDRRTSAERLRFDASHYRHLGSATHFDLLNHPAVAAALGEWVGPGRQLPGHRTASGARAGGPAIME